MTVPSRVRHGRCCALAAALATVLLLAGCGGSGALPTPEPGRPSIGAEASGLGVTLRLPDGWVSASAVGTVVVAEREGDLTRTEPEGPRLVVTRGIESAPTADTIRIPLITGEDEGAGMATVVEEPREVTVGGREGVSIGVEERVGSTVLVRRYVFVGVGGEALRFLFEAPAGRWPGALPVLETILGSAAIDSAPVASAGPTATPAGAVTSPPPLAPSRIAFMSDQDDDWELYVMDADGSNPVRLTRSTGRDAQPSWSPDGSRIAFRSDRDGNPEIYVMDADGANQVRLTRSEGIDIDPTWSPDGSRIAFSSDRDGSREIYVMDADGSNPVRLTRSPSLDDSPDWSPDGSRIVFRSDRGGESGIYVMEADGSDVVRLTTAGAVAGSPNWSPDGTRIAFSSSQDGDSDVYVMEADGSGVVRLTTSASSDGSPTWSPDGSRIAFVSGRDGDWDIYLMDADGAHVTLLTTSAAGEFSPAWSP